MRPGWVLGLLTGCLVTAHLGAEETGVASHPRDLQFAEGQVELPTAQDRRHQLSSGPVVYLATDHTLPMVEITVAMRGGSSLEPSDKTGLDFLTATQMRRGGAAGLAADQFDDQIEGLGALLDTMSGLTRTGATLSVPSWSLDEGLDLFFAMLTEPGFQPDRLAVARSNLLESLSRRNEGALEVLDREWKWLLYGEGQFQTRVMTPATLDALTRGDLAEHHAQYWRPQNMILAISGDFDEETLLADLENRFRGWPANDLEETATPWPPASPPMAAVPGLYHYEMDIPQAKVVLGHRIPGLLDWSDRDRFALAVVAEILGGQGAISRIAGRLRTAEGLIYRTSTDLYPGEFWPGEAKIFFESQTPAVALAVSLALAELERLRTEKVHPMELAVVKQSLLARLRLQFDTAEEIAGYFAEDELIGRPHSFWQRYLTSVSEITIDDVQRVAKKFLQPEAMVFLVVGRWPDDPAGSIGQGHSLESVTGHSRQSLRARDPLTLEIASEN